MKERPILFSGPMVRAILAPEPFTKKQTRRIIRTRTENHTRVGTKSNQSHVDSPEALQHCPYGQRGDLLWVRETWAHVLPEHMQTNTVGYRADYKDGGDEGVTWKPSIHMPRRFSRILLEVDSVGIERVQDISPQDAWAEGAHCGCLYPCSMCQGNVDAFRELWDSINAERGFGWDVNPLVWVVVFRRLKS